MKTILAAIGLLFVGACAPMTEQRIEERQYRQVEWELRYISYANRCSHAGGHMIIRTSHRTGRSGLPRRGEFYSCTENVGAAPRD